MADDARTHSGSVPEPIPEVRDEGPGGTDLSFSEVGDDEATEASRDGGQGHLPHPVRHGTTEAPRSSE